MNNNMWSWLINEIVDNRFLLTDLIGSGGFGAVFQASDLQNNDELPIVALKLIQLNDTLSKEKQYLELEQGKLLIYPNIVCCSSYGRTIIKDEKYLYSVMELAECSLENYLSDGKVLSEEETLKIAKDVALGLQYLQDDKRKLVHRDIKPANILKCGDTWKIGDFGIARQLGNNTMTQSRAIGSAYYAPPESYNGEISLAWDIWSLGVLICRCCSGELPFTASNVAEMMNKVLTQPPVIPSSVSKGVIDIIKGCLNKDRHKRYTINQLLNTIEEIEKTTIIHFINIPESDFLYGDKKKKIHLSEFDISKYPVTVAQYRSFCNASGKNMPESPSWGWHDSHPMEGVSYFDAKAFCDYYGYRLPTEEEWEKAARGTDGREYPWGNDWDKMKCAIDIPNGTQPVGKYPQGASPYGCLDMAGNVWEWTDSWRNEEHKLRVLRGGAWSVMNPGNHCFRCAYRCFGNPESKPCFYGFRVAR